MPNTADARHLLIPFAGRLTPECRAAIAGLQLPNLTALLTRMAPVDTDTAGAGSLSPPHERALARALGLAAPDGRLPWAAREAALADLTTLADGDGWARVTLCHWDVAIDEVVLGDPAALEIEPDHSRDLLEAARPFFEEDGIMLHASGEPGHWLARCAVFEGLATASLDRAIGQPISAWSAGVRDERALRRLQNEMQMLLYTQRANDERGALGQLPVNSFWISGTGVLLEDADLDSALPTVDDSLRQPALQDDGAAWAAAWRALDAGPLAALRTELERGQPVTLTLCGDRAAQRWQPQPKGGLFAWIKRLFNRPRPAALLEAL